MDDPAEHGGDVFIVDDSGHQPRQEARVIEDSRQNGDPLDSERTRASFDFFSFSTVSVKIKAPDGTLGRKRFFPEVSNRKGGPGGVGSTTGACHRAGSRRTRGNLLSV